MARNPRTGTTLDAYFKKRGELEEVQEIALRRMVAAELTSQIKRRGCTRVRFAVEMKTSRPQIDRLLDPQPRQAITTTTLARAAAVIGEKLALVDA